MSFNRWMDKENTENLYNGVKDVKNKDTRIFGGKWMELEKKDGAAGFIRDKDARDAFSTGSF